MHLEENQGGENAEDMGEKSPAVLGAGGSVSNNGNPSLGSGESDAVQDVSSGPSASDFDGRQEEGDGLSGGVGDSSLEGHDTVDGKGDGIGVSVVDTGDVGTSLGEPSSSRTHVYGGKAGGPSDAQSRNIGSSSSSSGAGASGGVGGSVPGSGGPLYLPWGARKDRGAAGPGAGLLGPTDMDARPGEFVMRTLFAEFTVQAERKIEAVMSEPSERPISKSLQRGEDPQFDQLLCAFGSVAEHCLPSLLRALFAWYDRQIGTPLEFQQFRSHQHHHRTPASALLSSLPISTSSSGCGGSGMNSSSSLGSPVPGATGAGSNSGSASGASSSSTPVASSSSPGPHHQQETGVLKKGGRISGSSVIGGLSVSLGDSSLGDKASGSGSSGVGGVSALVGVVGGVSDKNLGDKLDSGGSGGSSSSASTIVACGGSSGGATAHGGVEDEQRRTLAVEFLFCLALIEVLKQLPFHPGQDDLVAHIENLSFAHFKYREGLQSGPNAGNIHMIADLYAEVIGGLAQSRFNSVRKRFMTELGELRAREPGPHTTQSIISLLMGMKFFRVKMAPIEEFEASFQFMQECAQYFLEVKDKDIKHALAGLFVEILVPVAAAVKNEVNVPCLKNFVEMLYVTTLDMCTKSKHRLALFPLVTCLLCVSQKASFLQNWHVFLAVCLSHLKNRDPKMSRVALESLYRLLWVYMIRIKCESNSATQSRLLSIVHSLFPKGSKAVVPRDTPLNIFVKIIQFIAQERLDFAMREIVLDLLCVSRPVKVIMAPERMSVGLRAFLVVADSLQQKEGEPPMPRSLGVLPSGNTLRIKKTFLNKMLTEETARSIGMSSYFPYVRRIFDDILRALDLQFGRPLMMTNTQNVNKEPDEMMSGERKPRIDLFRTCVAAVPRLIPDGMSSPDLVDLLSRLTTHLDAELASLAFHSLQTLVMDFPDWRHHVICGFIQFLVRDVLDTFPQLLDNGIRMLLQLLVCWKNALIGATVSSSQQQSSGPRVMQRDASKQARLDHVPPKQENPVLSVGCGVFHFVEGFALVMLCQCRPTPRRLVVPILREAKALVKITGCSSDEEAVIDVIDRCCPKLVESILSLLPPAEKTAALTAPCVDLQWLTERSSSIWTAGIQEEGQPKVAGSGTSSSQMDVNSDPWFACLMGFLVSRGVGVLPTGVGGLLWQCPSAVSYSWPVAFSRLHSLFTVVDPSPVSDNRASLLRSSAAVKKPASERDVHMIAWRYLAAFAFRVVPPQPSAAATAAAMRSASPDLSLSSSPDSLTSDRGDSKSPAVVSSGVDRSGVTAVNMVTGFGFGVANSSTPGITPSSIMGATSPPSSLYKLVIPLLRYEATDVRDAAVNAIGRVNPEALKDVMEELVPCIREVVDRKQENMRRRRRRDALRLQLVRVLELIAENATFGLSPCVLDRDTHSLHPTFVEYVEGARQFLEAEEVKEGASLSSYSSSSSSLLRLHFCNFVRKMIRSFPLERRHTLLKRDLRRNLFSLFSAWSGRYGCSMSGSSTGGYSAGMSMSLYGYGFGPSSSGAPGSEGSSHLLSSSNVSASGGGAGGAGGMGSGPHGNSSSHGSASESCTELQLSALQAMSALLCCGPCFDPKGLCEEGGYFYPWLDLLLHSRDEKVYGVGCETVVLLLECNPDIGALLDWAVDRCYTAPPRVADACFLALATIFSLREYPCDHYTGIINVTLLSTGCPRAPVHETALQLLQLLDQRFFGDLTPPIPSASSSGSAAASSTAGTSTLTSSDVQAPGSGATLPVPGGEADVDGEKGRGTLDVLLSTTYCRSQMYLSRQLSHLHPELTMPMFSEITHRFQTARPEVRQLLLQYLLPWLHNMELVDPHVPPPNPLAYLQHCGSSENNRREGWGSAEATEMVLNNLFYITAKFGDEHPKEVEEVWATLCTAWPNNLKVIIRYLLIVSGMAPHQLLPYAKRVVVSLAHARPERLLEELLGELQAVETLSWLIERTQTPPFYRLTSLARKASSSQSEHGGNIASVAPQSSANTHHGSLHPSSSGMAPSGGGAASGRGGAHATAAPSSTGGSGGDKAGGGVTIRSHGPEEKGMIHTKRHSAEEHSKSGASKSDSALRALAGLAGPLLFSSGSTSAASSGASGPPVSSSPSTSTTTLSSTPSSLSTPSSAPPPPPPPPMSPANTKTRTASGPAAILIDEASAGRPISPLDSELTPTEEGNVQFPSQQSSAQQSSQNDSKQVGASGQPAGASSGQSQGQSSSGPQGGMELPPPPQPHPLPMPEYGGFFAPLTEYLPDASQPISGFHRCNVAVMLLSDVVVEGLPGIDWTPHLPLILHILFLGMDHARPLVHSHCRRLLLRLLIVLSAHGDHLTVARVLLLSSTALPSSSPFPSASSGNQQPSSSSSSPPPSPMTCVSPYTSSSIFSSMPQAHFASALSSHTHPLTTPHTTSLFGSSGTSSSSSHYHRHAMPPAPPPLLVLSHNFTEPEALFDSYLQGPAPDDAATQQNPENGTTVSPSHPPPVIITSEDGGRNIGRERIGDGNQMQQHSLPKPGPNMPISDVIKSMIAFLASREHQPLWNYEDITAKVWNVHSAEQLDCFLQHVLRIFSASLALPPSGQPMQSLAYQWANTALHLGLSCSSRHYAGRSLQVFRALRVPINLRMLTDILSRLVETVAEQAEDMQGYVTELLLTLEASVECLGEWDPRPLDHARDLFKSTPNLNNSCSTTTTSPCSSPCPSPSCSSASSSTSTLASTVQNNSGSTGCRRAGHGASSSSIQNAQLGHTRSTSFSVPYPSKRGGNSSHAADSKDPPSAGQNQSHPPPAPSSGASSSIGSIKASSAGNLSRSRSAQSLKGASIATGLAEAEDSPTILTTLFWLSVCLLESDFEHEFLLALRLLGRLLDRLPLDHPECRERMERVRLQLRWPPNPGNNGGPGSPGIVETAAGSATSTSATSRGSFPGVHALVLKGCTHPGTYEATIALLSQCTLLLDHPVIDPTVVSSPPSAPPPPTSQSSASASGIPASSASSSMTSTAFPMNVVALLPYLLLHFEDADNALCIRSAENIAQVSVEKSKKLENLGTVMTLYSRRTFSKESFQWTKCVVKYLYDSYSHLSLHMLAFLVEVLEKGPTNVQVPILSIIHCMLHYVDLASTAAQPINADLLRVIAKYIDGVHWKEALKILKLVVTRSSTLVAPPASLHHHHHHYSSSASLLLHHQHHHWGDPPTSMTSSAMTASTISSAYSSSSSHATYSSSSSSAAATLSSATAASFLSSVSTGLGSSSGPGATSFGETEIFSKKELPGRTMDFTFDLSQTPVIGRRYLHRGGEQVDKGGSAPLNLPHQPTSCSSSSSTSSPRRSASLTQADSTGGWKRPWLCQSRVRECLVSLLNTCGQRVGLPKSPSDGFINSVSKVIFSQSSDLLERQSSMASSSEEVSATPTNDMAAGGSPNVSGGIGAGVGGVVGAVGPGSIVPVPATSQGSGGQAMVGSGSISVSSSTSSSSGSSSTTVSSTGSSTVINPSNAPPSTTSASPSPSTGAIAGSGTSVGGNVGGGGGGGSSGSASASTSSVNAGGTEQFGVFRDFDFLEYESESLEGESTDNFNWGVRRRPLSDGGESEFDPVAAPSGMRAMSLEGPMELGRNLARMTGLGARDEEMARLLGTEATPLMAKRSRLAPDDSSDEEVGSESPLDETATSSLGQTPAVRSPTSSSTPLHHCTCSANSGSRGGGSTPEAVSQGSNSLFVSPMSIGLRERRRRRNRNDSGQRSDTSGSSIGDPNEVMGVKSTSAHGPERELSSGGGSILPDEERAGSAAVAASTSGGVAGVGSESVVERMMGGGDEGRSMSAAVGGALSPEPGMGSERRGGGEIYGDAAMDEDEDDEEEERDVWWRRRVQAILEDLPIANYAPRSRLALHKSLLAPFTLLRGILKDSCERGEVLAREGKRRLGCGIGVSDDLATMSSSLSSAINAVAALSRDPPSAWFGIPSSAAGSEFAAALGDGLRFALLEVQEHLDTYSDRKIQAVQGLRAAKAVCRSQRSLDASSVASGEASETWRVELGKVLYKLLFQLLLLVEASWKAIATLISTAGRFQLQDMSGELAVVKARLGKAGEEMEEGGDIEDYEEEEDDFEEEESESVSMGDEEVEPLEPPEEDEEEARALARLIRGGKWRAALVHVHGHRDIWSDECFAEDDVSLALNVYALRLVREKRDAFVVSCPEREVPELATQLKESLLLVLGSIKGLEGRVGKRGGLGPLGREGGALRRRIPRGGRGIERRGRVGEISGPAVGGAAAVMMRRRGGSRAPNSMGSEGRAAGGSTGSGGRRRRVGAEGGGNIEMEYEEEEEGDEDDEEEDETELTANLTEKSEG
ncbi:protein furry [Ischnura elegans]|uniref:protein furry n=1 Tax=Ischnura elegans TaxID=197161 RepID=UPI001ED8BC55|nr:protein furry [Ischnura elegans]